LATSNPRPHKRIKTAAAPAAALNDNANSVKKKKNVASALLMFAPPQLARKTPNASTEDLDKWNSAGTSKQRKLAKARGQSKN
jgi:hypothetical protein